LWKFKQKINCSLYQYYTIHPNVEIKEVEKMLWKSQLKKNRQKPLLCVAKTLCSTKRTFFIPNRCFLHVFECRFFFEKLGFSLKKVLLFEYKINRDNSFISIMYNLLNYGSKLNFYGAIFYRLFVCLYHIYISYFWFSFKKIW